MAIAYNEWDNRTDTIAAGIKQKILASSDWAHLQLTTGTQNTTLSSGASAGATSISTAATIPSGSYVVIGNGAANPEVRLTTAVSGAGPFTVSWTTAEPLASSYSGGAAVGVGSYVKATTTRGAQMVIDLAGTVPDTLTLKPTMYYTHDGTTAGTSLARFVPFKRTAGAATNILHCRCSVAKDWVYFDIEGPRVGETGADSSTLGSYRSCLYLGDIAPSDGGDTIPAVILAAGANGTTGETIAVCRVSRNRDNNQAWLSGRLCMLAYPQYGMATTNGNWNPVAKTGDYVTSPIIVFESSDGLRGRVQYLFHGGVGSAVVEVINDPIGVPQGAEMIYGSYKYRALYPFKSDASQNHSYIFGTINNSGTSTLSPILWVPVANYP